MENQTIELTVQELLFETENIKKKEKVFLEESQNTKMEIQSWVSLFALIKQGGIKETSKINKSFRSYIEVKNKTIDLSINLSFLKKEINNIYRIIDNQGLTEFHAEYNKYRLEYKNARKNHKRLFLRTMTARRSLSLSTHSNLCVNYNKAYEKFLSIVDRNKKFPFLKEVMKIEDEISKIKTSLKIYSKSLEKTLMIFI